MYAITSFNGPYRFLSNFYLVDIDYYGYIYPTVEHAYQASKCIYLEDKNKIRKAPSPGYAKAIGRNIDIDPSFDERKLYIMKDLIRIKFMNPTLAKMLKSTKNAYIIETNTWGDTYWGVCNNKGENHLGKLLMNQRKELLMLDEDVPF